MALRVKKLCPHHREWYGRRKSGCSLNVSSGGLGVIRGPVGLDKSSQSKESKASQANSKKHFSIFSHIKPLPIFNDQKRKVKLVAGREVASYTSNMHSSRVPIIAGNWKMNTTLADADVLATGVRDGVEHVERIEIVLSPPTIWLTEMAAVVPKGSLPHLALGAQNMYFEETGAFTGETSPLMVKEVAEYVILGHSERVHVFHEKAGLIADKVESALNHDLIPILCVGEDEQSATSKTEVATMLEKIIEDLSDDQRGKLVVAYEPVWAIGTGKAATPEYAQEVMKELRTHLPTQVRILYGGSVNEENAKGYLETPDCDGLLIGGTSLKLKPFVTICQIADDLAHQHGHTSKHHQPSH